MISPIEIQTIAIGERMVEITYMEDRDQTDKVMMVRTIAVDRTAIEGEFAEFVDAAREMVDAALLLQRNPEQRVRRESV